MGNQQVKEKKDLDRHVQWNSAECPSPPGKPYLAPDASERYVDVITIRWVPPVSNGGASILGYLVEHRRTGSPHWLRATPHLVPDTKLTLTGLEPGWRYQFRVSAENDVGLSNPSELSEPMTVTPQKWAASAPFFNVELHDQYGLENEKVEFRVHVIGVPPPTISWYKDGFEVFSSRRTKIVTEDDHSVFIIHQAALEDEGEIKCTATNRAGHAVTKANLKLEAPPRIRLPRQYEDGLIFEKGEPIRLKATVAGRPKPHVTWYHNGEPIRRTETLDIVDSKMGTMLKITNASRGDRGEYGIVGVNKIGEDVAAIMVTVTDRPSPPGKVQVKAFGRKVKLAWFSPEDDGGCKIGTYIVEYFRVGWDMWLKARNSRTLTTSIENLIEGSQYKFRVRAENPYGISDPSEESDLIFIPDPQRGVFEPSAGKKAPQCFQEIKRPLEPTETDEREPEEVKKRRFLEEKARKLLDTPMSELLPYTNTLPDNRKAESTPETIDIDIGNENVPPFVPRRKNKGKNRLKLKSTVSDLDIRANLTPSPAEEERVNSNSELTTKTRFLEVDGGTFGKPGPKPNDSKRSPSELNVFSLDSPLYPRETDDSDIHGSSELMLVIYPRDRSKSIELSSQHRSDIELDLKGEGVAPPMSLSSPELGFADSLEIPRLRNAVSSTELLAEKTAARLYQDSIEEELQRTMKKRCSADRKSGEKRSSLVEPLPERRRSFVERSETLGEPVRRMDEPVEKPRGPIIPQSPVPSRKPKTNRERMSSVEKERLEFAQVRERLRLKEEENRLKGLPVPSHYQLSDTTTTTSSSLKTDDYDDDDDDIDDEDDDEHLKKWKKTLSDERDHNKFEGTTNRLKAATSNQDPFKRKQTTVQQQEDDTYHPRSKVPVRSIITTLSKAETGSDTSSATPSLSGADTPKPKQKKTSKILKKFSLKKGKKVPEIAETDPNLPPPPKPILKNKIPPKSKISPMKRLMPVKPSEKPISEEESETEVTGKKKKVRITEPKPEEESNIATETSIDKNSVENQVLIYHYSDILREFGGPNRPRTRPYLGYEPSAQHQARARQPQQTTGPDNRRKEPKQEPEVVASGPKSHQLPKVAPLTNTTGRIHASLEYAVDVAMFLLACWLYFFKNELYAIPILSIMAYRQLKDIAIENYRKLKAKFDKNNPGEKETLDD